MKRLFLVLLFAACKGNGHIIPAPFTATPTDDVVHCTCNVTFDYSSCTGGTCEEHFDLDMCIPPDVRARAEAALPSAIPDGGLASTGYGEVLNEYCRDTMTTTIYHLIKVWNGGWCQYKAPYAPEGGVGRSVICFAQEIHSGKGDATIRDDGTCDKMCTPVVCDYATNCHDVQDSLGNVDLSKCMCNVVTNYSCPGDNPNDLPTQPFCRAPAGTPGS
jgi:hypothetical protein